MKNQLSRNNFGGFAKAQKTFDVNTAEFDREEDEVEEENQIVTPVEKSTKNLPLGKQRAQSVKPNIPKKKKLISPKKYEK